MRRSDGAHVALALEQNLESNEGVELENTVTIDSIVAAPPSYRYLLEASLPQQPLAQTLEATKGLGLDHRQESIPVIRGDGDIGLPWRVNLSSRTATLLLFCFGAAASMLTCVRKMFWACA